MKALKDIALLFLAVATPAFLALATGALIDAVPVLGWMLLTVIIIVAVYFLFNLIKVVRDK